MPIWSATRISARGFYIAAAVLAATGGGLLWWDLHTDSVGVQTHF